MTRRDLSNFNTIANVVADNPSQIPAIGAELGQKIIQQSQQAKIIENMSAAQLELGQLSNDFQKNYSLDPFNKDGMDAYKSGRQEIISRYGGDISPLFKNEWQKNASNLTDQNDLQMQAWGFKQSASNSKVSLIKAADNHLQQAGLDGEAFGQSSSTEIDAFMGYANAHQALNEYGKEHLGEAQTNEITKDFEQDYAKVFISGVAHSNPAKALQLMDNPAVRDTFTNQEEFMKFRDAVENRALKVGEVGKRQEILSTLKDEANLFGSGKALSYAEIQQATSSMSEEARNYFLKANGYAKDPDAESTKLNAEQKLQYKSEVYDKVNQLATKENIEPADIVNLQNAVFSGMDKGALTQEEGANYLNQIVTPAVAGKEKNLQEFTGGTWNPFKENVGFEGLQKYYEKNLEIKPPDGKDKVGEVSQALNAANKVQLYDNYMGALDEQASKRGIKIADISNQKDSYEIYKDAQANAIQRLATRTTPVLKFQPAIPISAIAYLTKNPTAADQFDAKYGTGASNRILGK